MPAITIHTKPSNKPVPLQENELRSHTHRFNKNSVAALSGYSVSINTNTQNWHPIRSTTNRERVRESTKALQSQYIAIQSKHRFDQNDKLITFYLPKEQGNYRAEISSFRPIRVAASSIYYFDFKATSLPSNLILFQVRELGGSMKKLGGDRPSFSLHIKQDGRLVAAINTVNQNSDSIGPDAKTYQNENISLKQIELAKYYHFTIEMIMHRDTPSIKISIGDEEIYQRDTPFGAADSKTFYSKLGAYVPQQKNKAGISDSKVSFDNIKEAHYPYTSPGITERKIISSLPSPSKNISSLPDAITTFDTVSHNMTNVDLPNIGKHMLTLGIAVITPFLIF
ncbi:hypothetical protein [Yersinia bercovieri]|uniref:hypothetical protein n=1 Tax=Yersinia bercovieri TaxID=634 RepID=UPI00119FC514|nr:hypothetical protein [Yersinia bercovieri]